ncbi:acyltransferase [Putridiphycobacter roseus]|uniref:Acyltransferase n=1 Tax=Putridiphycobacter roseus TaxID=2219161 RepID=A0A2W1NV32_9FLAO|nr:acyltransferase [Putridiphycobacter roseus]PZE18638.1 acyltransferase [Putridiphycobacter roseus]
MDRLSALKNKETEEIFSKLNVLHEELSQAFSSEFDRSLPFNELLLDRWERAKKLGWGNGTSIYDNAYVFGDVTVGENTWIGPFTIIDGTGSLTIGDFCTISAGVHLYSHDNVLRTLSGNRKPILYAPLKIGSNTYIGPQSIISKGISIGDYVIIGANSFVNKDVPSNAIVAGNPAKVIGKVICKGDEIVLKYGI